MARTTHVDANVPVEAAPALRDTPIEELQMRLGNPQPEWTEGWVVEVSDDTQKWLGRTGEFDEDSALKLQDVQGCYFKIGTLNGQPAYRQQVDACLDRGLVAVV